MNTLKSIDHQLSVSDTQSQLNILEESINLGVPSFKERILKLGKPLTATGVEILQVNVGKMCNQTCKHCHVDAGPDRKEIMTRDTMQTCLDILKDTDIKTVDITGGAPELNPTFRWFVEELHKLGKAIIVRCNLTIIVANPKYHDLPEFYRKYNVEVISSLPYFSARRTDSQRGEGVFEKSIKALKMLNNVGYGIAKSGLTLNLVYNPTGAFLPDNQEQLEVEFKTRLWDGYGISFNSLYAITNLPISRFLNYLLVSDNYHQYMDELSNSFNPEAVDGVMCKNTLSISWDGYIYDCDFNQMLDLKVNDNSPSHIKDFDLGKLNCREIVLNQHCYGCTAGAGSSCGGATI
jgi:radical SAM/Cys-rich protein